MKKTVTYALTRDLQRICFAALVLLPALAGAQVIHMKDRAAAETGQNVRLGDLASITGADAKTGEGLLNLIIVPGVKDSRTLRAETVLMAVIAQIGPGALADRLQIAGSATCSLQVGPAGAPAPKPRPAEKPAQVVNASAIGAATPGNSKPPVPPPASTAGQPTLAHLIIARLEQDLNVHPGDLRVTFETMNPQLDQPTPAGRKWVFRPLTRSLQGTVQFEVQLVETTRVLQKFTVEMQVLKRQDVLVTTAPLLRQDVLTAGSFKHDEAWLDRSMPTLLADEKEAIGLQAIRDLPAGAMLDQRDFHPVVMANRSEIISVIFLRGNIKVQMKGRAVQDGKLHDVIQVKNESTNELYDAVLIGKRLAVIGGNLDEAQEKKLREAR